MLRSVRQGPRAASARSSVPARTYATFLVIGAVWLAAIARYELKREPLPAVVANGQQAGPLPGPSERRNPIVASAPTAVRPGRREVTAASRGQIETSTRAVPSLAASDAVIHSRFVEASAAEMTFADARARWSAESDDPEWSAQVTDSVTTMLDDLQIAGHLNEVTCRETICFARLEFANIAEAESAGSAVGDSQFRWVELRSDDSTVFVDVYVAKQ
jgi:hypothetical protein